MKYSIVKISVVMLLVVASLSAMCQNLQHAGIDSLCEGDLLFCVKNEGNPITDVTNGVGGMKIDHVAIFCKIGQHSYVLEAIQKGVCLTPIDSFMTRRGAVLPARLKDTVGVALSVERALKYLGKPYDFNFMPDDSAFYCSELVQKSYRYKSGELVFKPIPMSFHDKTGKITQYGKDYESRQGLQVPEGEPGSNPGDVARSEAIKIICILER